MPERLGLLSRAYKVLRQAEPIGASAWSAGALMGDDGGFEPGAAPTS